ncbi:MAG: right-handed parallel beta-helix repeat-containing protein [Rhodospirillales bacterium]|nr:right-handed parallel beta-helix repeat-containing protein [Rhodospirillales bacterium]
MAAFQAPQRPAVRSNAQTDDEASDASASPAVGFTDEPSHSTTTTGVSLDASSPVTATVGDATMAALAVAAETTASAAVDLGAALQAAMAGGYLAHLTGPSYTVTSSIVINVDSTIQGPMGIDLGGAHIVSQITDGSPVIQINVGPGVDLRYVTLSNFTIEGNGLEGDGIRIVADGNDRWMYCWTLENVTVQNVGGFGLDVRGSVFEGIVSNSWMIGNAEGGATFAHSDGGGQVSALRWFGGGFEDNGGSGLLLDNGARDISVDGASFANNAGPGINAASGITAVSDSAFRDNGGVGVWFQNFGNFNDNTFSSSGVQAVGISGYLAGGATLVGNSSTYTGPTTGIGSDTTALANLQGNGTAFLVDDSGKVVTGQNVAVSGEGGGNLAHVTVSTDGVDLAALPPVDTAAAVADSRGTGVLESALKAALSGGGVVHLTDTSYTVTSPIVINITASFQGSLGIDLGGAKILSQIADGGPVIQINIGAGVDIGTLTLSNFSIQGNGLEGDGIRIVADGADRWIRDLDIRNVNVEHVGGIGLDLLGNIQGRVFDSWMHGDGQGGARIANSAGGGVAEHIEWIGGGFRKNDVAGLILDNGAHDLTVQGAYFVDNRGPGIQATSGITLVHQSGFENNLGTGAIVGGAASFADVTFSTWGVQTVGIGGYLTGDQVSLLGIGSEYYGAGADPTVLANLQGAGVLAIAGTGNVVVGPGITLAGGMPFVAQPQDTIAPVVSSIATSSAGILAGDGILNADDVVLLTVALSESVTVNGTPTLLLNDGGVATYVGGSGTAALSFSYTVAAGENTPDLEVMSFDLNGATVRDAAGNAANLTVAAGYDPAGILKVDTTAVPPTVTQRLANDTGASDSDLVSASPALVGSADAHAVVRFTVDGSPIAATATADANGVWSFMPTGLADGAHTIDASQTNAAGATGTASLSFTLDTTAPTPVFTGAVLADGQVTLSGMTGSAGDTLSIYDGWSWLGFATTGSDGRFTFTAAADPHAVHLYAANASDLAGNLGRTATSYVVDPTPPPVVTVALSNDTGTSSTDRITSDLTLGGTAATGAIVHFAIDGSAIGATATADANGVWSFKADGLADGAHTIVASETSASGATGAASASFVLDTTAPQPVIDGAVQANGQVTLTGWTGGAGDTLSIYDGWSWLGFAVTGNDGRFSFTANAAVDAMHSYGANASDLAGHAGQTEGVLRLGSASADSLAGSTAGDILQGGGGADRLTGGAGADRFVYRATADSSAAAPDTITDFQHGVDQIDFRAIGGLNAADGISHFQGQLSGVGNLTLNPHSVAFLETAGNTLVLANTTDVAETIKETDSHAADMKIVLLGTHLGLTSSDFDLF